MLHAFALGKELSYRVANTRLQEIFKSPFGRPSIPVIPSYGFYEQEIAMLDPDINIKDKTYRLEDVQSIKEVTNDVQTELVFVFRMGSVIPEIP